MLRGKHRTTGDYKPMLDFSTGGLQLLLSVQDQLWDCNGMNKLKTGEKPVQVALPFLSCLPPRPALSPAVSNNGSGDPAMKTEKPEENNLL